MTKPEVRGFFDAATATWTYVVWADKKCAVIDSVLDYDPASGRTSTASADKVIYFIRNKGLQVEWILETHIHADHLTAAHYLKEKLGGKTGISEHILAVLKTWQPVFHNEADTPLDGSQFDHLFNDDERFSIGTLDARIIATPGHTPADTTYIIGDAAFVGDAMFLPDVGTGRCDFLAAAPSISITRRANCWPCPMITACMSGMIIRRAVAVPRSAWPTLPNKKLPTFSPLPPLKKTPSSKAAPRLTGARMRRSFCCPPCRSIFARARWAII